MLSHFERHPVQGLTASLTGIGAGAAHAFHVIGGFAADISAILGMIIGLFTILGWLRSFFRKRDASPK